jgi:hypothetical protein
LALDFFTADLLNGAKVHVLAVIEHGTRRTAISCRSTSSSSFLEADGRQDQPAAEPDEDEVDQARGHG